MCIMFCVKVGEMIDVRDRVVVVINLEIIILVIFESKVCDRCNFVIFLIEFCCVGF